MDVGGDRILVCQLNRLRNADKKCPIISQKFMEYQ